MDEVARALRQSAQTTLGAVGFNQKGRSRTWLADRGWWLGVVEFQPSSVASASYLNVGVQWLWRPGTTGVVSFDYGFERLSGLQIYENDEQWNAAAERMAAQARDWFVAVEPRLVDLRTTSKLLRRRAGDTPGWATLDAAVSAGLAGKTASARKQLRDVLAVQDDRDWWQAVRAFSQELASLLDEEAAFRKRVVQVINTNRLGLGLQEDWVLPDS